MRPANTLSSTGTIFLDPRGGGRAMRVTWHPEADVVVLSLWRDNVCAGSFRLAVEEVPTLIDTLRAGLDAAYRHAPTRTPGVPPHQHGAPPQHGEPTQPIRPASA